MVSNDGDNFTIEYEYEKNEKGNKIILGTGSFGTVYSGVDMVTRKKMAIKEIPVVEGADSGYVNCAHIYVVSCTHAYHVIHSDTYQHNTM